MRASGIAGRALALSRWTSSASPATVCGSQAGCTATSSAAIASAASSLMSADPVTASIASMAWSSGRKAQCAALRIHWGAITVPVQPAALSSSPSPSSSQAASRKAIEGQSAMSASLPPTTEDGRDRVRDGGRGGEGEREQQEEEQQSSRHAENAIRRMRPQLVGRTKPLPSAPQETVGQHG